MCLHKFLHGHSAVAQRLRVQATEQSSGVFLRNHLGSKKNTSVIIVITFCNYPYATRLEQRKTTVSLLPRSSSKHGRAFHGVARFKGGVTLLQLCQHSDETRKHGEDGKALVFKASKARSTYTLFLCRCQTGRQRGLFAVLISERELLEWCCDGSKWPPPSLAEGKQT